MTDIEQIKQHWSALNYLVLCEMYLNQYKTPDDIKIKDLKSNNPGHLGCSTGINFILANLNSFINENNLTSQLIIGTGHAGASLWAEKWLDGSLEQYYPNYQRTLEGCDNIIGDFGKKIRSEICVQYPDTIYEGGELGYSLATAYGYAKSGQVDIVPCIIGDGEAETGTLSSSWFLGKMFPTQSKVLPIINLNGLKMGSKSFLAMLSDSELEQYFSSLGYETKIIDATIMNINDSTEQFQNALYETIQQKHPLIIFKSNKGWLIPELEKETLVHKNPLVNIIEETEKLKTLLPWFNSFYLPLFDQNGKLLDNITIENQKKINSLNLDIKINSNISVISNANNIKFANNFLKEIANQKNFLLVSPDEIYSNQLGDLADCNCFEMLNENVLQAILTGYIEAGGNGIFIGYEGFMPIVSSMINQYYKMLKQKDDVPFVVSKNSLNYLLTSICWENTYSHQNPSFVSDILLKDDKYYNVLYPKDGNELIQALIFSLKSQNQINIITISKRMEKQYPNISPTDLKIQTIVDETNPDIILCATGDYMLDCIINTYHFLVAEDNHMKIKMLYITNPKILDIDSKIGITEEQFSNYFSTAPVMYLYNGYAKSIESLLYKRKHNFEVFGYQDNISIFGGKNQTFEMNGINSENITAICKTKIKKEGY